MLPYYIILVIISGANIRQADITLGHLHAIFVPLLVLGGFHCLNHFLVYDDGDIGATYHNLLHLSDRHVSCDWIRRGGKAVSL